jgi:hypothetical protein
MAKATSVNLDWCSGRKWKTNNKRHTEPPKLFCSFYSTYTMHKYGCVPHNTTWRGAGCRSLLYICNGISWINMGKLFWKITCLLTEHHSPLIVWVWGLSVSDLVQLMSRVLQNSVTHITALAKFLSWKCLSSVVWYLTMLQIAKII